MPNRLPVLSIWSPLPDAVVGNAPFTVMGVVTAPGEPEPVYIESVAVEILGQPGIVQATLTRSQPSGDQPVQVTFKATMQITGGQDPHGVVVGVKSDAGLPVVETVTVTVGPRLVAPSALIDIQILPFVVSLDPTFEAAQLVTDPRVQSLLATIAQAMAKLQVVKDVSLYWMVVGPNVGYISNPPTLRVGFWILEQDFAPSDLIFPTADFPMLQMTPEAAKGCFALVPPLVQPPYDVSVPPAEAIPLTFALSISTPTLQLIADALLPTINSDAGRHSASVDSITVQTGSDDTLIFQISGSYLGISVSGSVTELLGPMPRAGTESNMAAVVTSTASSGLLDILSVLIPFLGTLVAALGEGYVQGKAQSVLGDVLNELPAWIPFRNSSLGSSSSSGPSSFQTSFPFPMLVLNFATFGTNDAGITGTGVVGLAARDQSMVAVSLTGPKSFPNYTPGTDGTYDVSLTAFEPDDDVLLTQVSGGGVNSGNTVNTNPFLQGGSFSTDFPISSGSETFTLTVSGTETCATDSTQKLTGSHSLAIQVTLPEDHKAEAAPAANATVASDVAADALPAPPKMPLAS
jgi:hypothetical protein